MPAALSPNIVVGGVVNLSGAVLGPSTSGTDGTPTAVRVAPDGSLVTTSGGYTLTDLSGSITLGGTSQQLATANTARKGFAIENISTGNIFFNEMGAAAVNTQAGSSMTIPPGSLYESPPNGVSTQAININGATTGQAFAARQW